MTTAPAPGNEPPRLQIVENWQPLAPTAPGQPAPRRTSKTTAVLATLTAAAGLYAGAGGPLRYITLGQAGRHAALYTAAAAAIVLLATVVLSKARTLAWPPAGQAAVTIGALVCTSVGLNTAWGFTHTYLGITDTFTRVALCGTGEIVLVALALAARDNLKRDLTAGTPGVLVWIITAFLAVPAFAEGAATATGFWSGLTAGAWRAAFGPLAAAVLWHFAMGLEIRAADATARSMGVLARLGRRLGQKILAAFGIADTDTTTTELLRQRARVQAANLTDRYDALSDKSKGGWRGRWIRRRLRAALRAANVAHDERQKQALLADLAVSSHAPTLAELAHDNPWGLSTTGAANGRQEHRQDEQRQRQNAASNDRQNAPGGPATGASASASNASSGRQEDRQNDRQEQRQKTDKKTATSGNGGTGGARKDRQNTAKKTASGGSKRRSPEEWVTIASPIFDRQRDELGAVPTARQFADAIATEGLGEVSESTAKNIRQWVLAADAQPSPN